VFKRRVTAFFAVVALVSAACSTSTSPSVTPSSTVPGASASPTAAGSAASPGTAGSIDNTVFGTNYAPQPGKSGGTIIMGEWQAAAQLNPYYTNAEADIEAIQPMMRSFATISSDGKYIPDLATEIPTTTNGGITVSGSTMTMVLHLKPGLMWSDGTPLTMNDFKYTWQWALNSDQSGCVYCGTSNGFPLIDSIDVSSDGLTATIHFKSLFGGWLGSLATWWPLPQHYMSTIAVKDAAKNSYPVSAAVENAPVSGPFKISNIVSGPSGEIDYVPNPYWHGGVSSAHAPYLSSLKFQYFGDQNGEIAAFLNGSIDVGFDLLQDSYPAIDKVAASVGTASLTPLWEYEHFDLNNDPNGTRGNGLNDVNVRKAIAMAVDKQSIINADFPGTQLVPACSPTPPGVWYAKAETCPSYDPAGAQQLLTQAGWTVDSSGWVAKNGHEMNLELCTTSGNTTRLTELQKLEADLQAIHVKSYIKTADAASVVFAGWSATTPTTDCSIYRGTYDIADFAYVLTGTPYGDYYFTYSSSQWPELGDHSGGNDTRFKSTAMDNALNALATDVPLQSMLNDAQAVQDAYVAGIPEIPLYYRSEAVAVGARLGNWPGYSPASVGPTWNVEDWYVK
jgi:peptide/nickel transport system substrate-binding protein